jgi:hypothetical protein
VAERRGSEEVAEARGRGGRDAHRWRGGVGRKRKRRSPAGRHGAGRRGVVGWVGPLGPVMDH